MSNKMHLQRIRHYMDWSVNSIQYLAMKEVHSTFLECFLKTAANFDKKDDGEWSQSGSMNSNSILCKNITTSFASAFPKISR